MRRLRISSAAIATLALVLAACGGTQQGTPSAGSSDSDGGPSAAPSSGATGGTVRIGWGGSPDSLNPGNGVLTEAYTLYEIVYDTPI